MGLFNSLFGLIPELPDLPGRRLEGGFVLEEQKPSSHAIIYRSELDVISRFILDFPNLETGGQLFGYWTSTGTPVVLYAIGPGVGSRHHHTSFFQDMGYLRAVGTEIHNRYRLQHIGEWHSHHQMSLSYPSEGDVRTMRHAVSVPGFPRMLLCIGNCTPTETTLNAFNFHQSTSGHYLQAQWDIVEADSPYRQLIDQDLGSVLVHPYTLKASCSPSLSPKQGRSIPSGHWLTEKVENVEVMKAFLEEAKTLSSVSDVKMMMLDSGEPAIQLDINDVKCQILFPFGFPEKSPSFRLPKVSEEGLSDGDYEQQDMNVEWEYPQSTLKEAFSHWLTAVQPFYPQNQQNQESHTVEPN